MSINHLQRPRLVVVGNGMAGMRTVGEGDKIYHTAEKLLSPGPINTRRHHDLWVRRPDRRAQKSLLETRRVTRNGDKYSTGFA
jgi:hypothetical protein